ncbi:hypothetical protein [Novacetimonas hansenii]|uniref:Uncharacterized protein n=2 Tax=Novacetimonas hansenii TaxID=436 RepID=D5QGJ3_NOVHA|nr:hypothetical protein [Novacetimonas hansenii]EFG83849.1 hypothetical protein GXY_11324 [Novacetimonas hansenii ATCC 23769]GBQ53814.1 hypothetical protein AA0243_0460 [Novacetimonas hansenii NRIC 0243]
MTFQETFTFHKENQDYGPLIHWSDKEWVMQDTSREKKQDIIEEWRPALVLVWKDRRHESAGNRDRALHGAPHDALAPIDDEDAYIHDEF